MDSWILTPSRYGYAEQECDKKARKRRFAGNCADGRKRFARLPRGRNGQTQPVSRGLQIRVEFSDRARHVGCGIDGAFGGAGLNGRFGCHEIHDLLPKFASQSDEAATFGYPRVRLF